MTQSMNPMQIIAMIKNGQNPQQLVLSMIEKVIITNKDIYSKG